MAFGDCKVKVGAAATMMSARLRHDPPLGRPPHGSATRRERSLARGRPARQVEPLLKFDISCVEQPVPHGEVGRLAELRRSFGVPMMLDESLTSMADAEAAIAGGTCDLFNIRLSKCGGFLASLRLAAIAHAAGLGYQLGCHPGESGMLSAAGRHWACSVAEHSLPRRLVRPPPVPPAADERRHHVRLRRPCARRSTKPGLGVTVNESVLATKQTHLTAKPVFACG